VLAACAAFDVAQVQLDRRIDRLVVARLEVQARHLLDRAPIASIEPLVVVHQQAGGDRAAVAFGEHQHEVLRQRFADALEERQVQVRRRTMRGVGRLVAAHEERPVRGADVAAVQPAQAHAGLGDLAPLGADLLALGLCQRRQKGLEVGVARVAPVELHAVPQRQPGAPQRLGLGFEREQHVQRRQLRRTREREQRARRRLSRRRVARCQARARHGREGDRRQQLRVVAQPVAAVRVGPGPVEHVLAVRVQLQVRGNRSGRRAARVAQQQVPRNPAGFLADTAGQFERAQELVAQERLRRRAAGASRGQRIPVVGRDTRQIVEDLRAIIVANRTVRQRSFLRCESPQPN